MKRAAKTSGNTSCGLLMYDVRRGHLFVLLVHPGGPYWRNRDAGAWTIPKGAPKPGESLLAAAEREFNEETGFVPHGPYLALTPRRQSGRKLVYCWAFRGQADLRAFRSVPFEMEWPPHSGKIALFPEADRAAFASVEEAMVKILPSQAGFIDELQARRRAGALAAS